MQTLGLASHYRSVLVSKRHTLERVGIFSCLNEADLDVLAAVARPLHVDRGTVLQQQGSPPDALYILTRGICKVSQG
jgi:CRP-like cAMP-binding protein